MKTILIIAAGYFQVPAIKAAKGLGHYVITTDINPNAPGFKWADESYVISSRDIDGILRLARMIYNKRGLDGVMTIGTDVSHVVARVAGEFGLVGMDFEDAMATSVNKANMRERFLRHNLSQPQFYIVRNLKEAINVSKYMGYPIVIKPIDSMGARGVVRIDGPNDFPYAFREAYNSATDKNKFLVEEYIEGHELSIDCLIYKGRVYFLCIGDRIIRFPPHFIEIGHNVPSQLSKRKINQAKRLMLRAIKALNIENGAAKGDIIVNGDGAFIGEVAGRLSGGFMSSHTLPLSTGINAAREAVRIALGEEPDLIPKFSKAAVERAILPEPGRVVAIEGVERAKAIDGVEEIHLNCKIGTIIEPLKSNVGKAGNIIVSYQSLEGAIEIVNKALREIKIITE